MKYSIVRKYQGNFTLKHTYMQIVSTTMDLLIPPININTRRKIFYIIEKCILDSGSFKKIKLFFKYACVL